MLLLMLDISLANFKIMHLQNLTNSFICNIVIKIIMEQSIFIFDYSNDLFKIFYGLLLPY